MSLTMVETASATAGVTIGGLVRAVADRLRAAGVPDARNEARDLVAAVAGEARFWPGTEAETAAGADLVERVWTATARRASGAPFAYAVGRAAFRHLTLEVTERVLIPRQETEVLVHLVLRARAGRPGGVVADVGTGSGAIALALATEGQFDRIIASDVSRDALELARRNAVRCGPAAARVEFRSGDLLSPLAGERLDVLVSNPPYIAFEEAAELPASVRDWEPGVALFSPDEGLRDTARLVAWAPMLLCTGGLLALEVDSRRASRVAGLVAQTGAFEDIAVEQDLTGRDRFVVATRRVPSAS